MWQKLQPREKILLATLGACIVIFLLFNFILVPQYDAFSENRDRLTELETKAKVAQNILSSEKAESELAAKATEKLNEVKPLFNKQMTDGLAVSHIGFEAMKNNVRIDSFVPSDIVNKGSYLELPTKLVVSGDYLNVISFIQRVEGEGMPNLADLRTIKIQPEKTEIDSADSAVKRFLQENDNSSPTNQNGRVTAMLDLVIYSSATPEERLKLEQEAGWPVGRQNAFQTPGGASPFPGIEAPAQADEAPQTNGEDLLSTFVKQLLNQGVPNSNNTLPGSSGTVELETPPEGEEN